MKYLRYSALILSSMLLIAACGDDKQGGKQEQSDNKDPVLTTEDDELEHEIDEPFLFPFGLNLDDFTATGYREGCAGDCCSGIRVLQKGNYSLFLDTLDCWEYGYTEKYLLYRGDELIASHEKSFDMGEYEDDLVWRYRTERTIDFENEKVFIRQDTVKNSEKKWMNKPFYSAIYSSGDRVEIERFMRDPRERLSFDEESAINLNRFGDEGALRPVLLYHSLSAHEIDIEVMEAYALQGVTDKKSRGIPEDAVFAYSTWYAGGGDLLYGIINDGVLQVYQAWEEEATLEISPYELILEVDPDLELEAPDHYIVFDPAKGKNKLMMAFNDEDQALHVKYQGQARHIELRKVSDKLEGKKIITVYQELIHGIPNGTYTHTHDGNWDYVTYKGKNGKEVKFTINHELSVLNDGDGYRERPLF